MTSTRNDAASTVRGAARAVGLTSQRDAPTKYRCVATLALVRRLVVTWLAVSVVVTMHASAIISAASEPSAAAEVSQRLAAASRSASSQASVDDTRTPASVDDLSQRQPAPLEGLAGLEDGPADDELDLARSLPLHGARSALIERFACSAVVLLRSPATLERPPRA